MDAISKIVKTHTGQWLAHNRLSRVERAFLAADLVTGACQLVEPTVAQAARLARVSNTYVHWAIHRLSERKLITDGAIPLMPYLPASQLALPRPADVSPVTDSQLVEIVRLAGTERAFKAIEQVL
jgi:hypothetical protein